LLASCVQLAPRRDTQTDGCPVIEESDHGRLSRSTTRRFGYSWTTDPDTALISCRRPRSVVCLAQLLDGQPQPDGDYLVQHTPELDGRMLAVIDATDHPALSASDGRPIAAGAAGDDHMTCDSA